MKGLRRFVRVIIGQAIAAGLVYAAEEVTKTSIPGREVIAPALGAAANAIAKEIRERAKMDRRRPNIIASLL